MYLCGMIEIGFQPISLFSFNIQLVGCSFALSTIVLCENRAKSTNQGLTIDEKRVRIDLLVSDRHQRENQVRIE
jgi:hypothetical protein